MDNTEHVDRNQLQEIIAFCDKHAISPVTLIEVYEGFIKRSVEEAISERVDIKPDFEKMATDRFGYSPDVVDRISDYIEGMEKMYSHVLPLQQKNDKLKGSYNALDDMFRKVMRENAQLKEENERWYRQHKELEIKFNSYISTNEKANEQYSNLLSEYIKLKEELKSIHEACENDYSKGYLTTKIEKIDALCKQLDERDSEINKLKERVKELEERELMYEEIDSKRINRINLLEEGWNNRSAIIEELHGEIERLKTVK